MNKVTISDSIKYVGANDKTIDLFESQYKVPNGVSYNSYVILDEKIEFKNIEKITKNNYYFSTNFFCFINILKFIKMLL